MLKAVKKIKGDRYAKIIQKIKCVKSIKKYSLLIIVI